MHRPTCLRYTNRPHAGPCAATRPTRSAVMLAAALRRTAAYQEAAEPSEEEMVEALRIVRDRLGEGVAAKLAAVLGVNVLQTDDDNGVEDLAPSEQPLLGPIAASRAAPAAKREAGALFPLGGEHPGKAVSRRAAGLRAQATARAYAAGRAAGLAAAARVRTGAELDLAEEAQALEAKLAELEVREGIGPHPAEVLAYAGTTLAGEALRLAQLYQQSPHFVRAHSLESYLAAQLGEPPAAARPAPQRRASATGDLAEVAAYAASGLLREARHMAQVYAASPAFVRMTPLRDYIAAQLGAPA